MMESVGRDKDHVWQHLWRIRNSMEHALFNTGGTVAMEIYSSYMTSGAIKAAMLRNVERKSGES